jgi:hypothetical protein
MMNHRKTLDEQHVFVDKIRCTATGILTHAGKLAAISRRTKKIRADGLDGRSTKMR